MNLSVLKIFVNNKIDLKDIDNIELFEEYIDMRNRGEKFQYVVHHLSEKYGCSPRSISGIAARMQGDITLKG